MAAEYTPIPWIVERERRKAEGARRFAEKHIGKRGAREVRALAATVVPGGPAIPSSRVEGVADSRQLAGSNFWDAIGAARRYLTALEHVTFAEHGLIRY